MMVWPTAHDLVDELAVQALAVCGQLALPGRFAPSAGLVAVALLPPGSAFAALLGTALARRSAQDWRHAVAAPSGAVGGGWLVHQGATRRTAARGGPRLPWHDGDAGRSQVQADGVRAYGVLGLVMGQAFEHQLHEVALSLPVGAWARGRRRGAGRRAYLISCARPWATTGSSQLIRAAQLVVVPQQQAVRVSLVLGL